MYTLVESTGRWSKTNGIVVCGMLGSQNPIWSVPQRPFLCVHTFLRVCLQYFVCIAFCIQAIQRLLYICKTFCVYIFYVYRCYVCGFFCVQLDVYITIFGVLLYVHTSLCVHNFMRVYMLLLCVYITLCVDYNVWLYSVFCIYLLCIVFVCIALCVYMFHVYIILCIRL